MYPGFWSAVFFFCSMLGLFLAGVLFFMKRGKSVSNKLLSLLILINSLLLFEYLLQTSGTLGKLNFYIPVLTPITFLIGPLYFFYVESSLTKNFVFRKNYFFHFIPAIFLFLNYIPYYLFLTDFNKSITDTDQLFLINISGYVLMAAFIIQTLIYIKFSLNILRECESDLKNRTSSFAIIRSNWLKKLTSLYYMFMLIQIFAFIVLVILPKHIIEIEYLMQISAASIIFAAAFYSITSPEILNDLVINDHVEKYSKSGLTPEVAEIYTAKLKNYVLSEKPFLNENLKISDLSEKLQISTNHLSQILNQNLNTNFYDFINSYRIEEAKSKIT